MSFDYYASLDEQKACPKKVNEGDLASVFVDGCTVWSCQDKRKIRKYRTQRTNARKCYMKRAAELDLNLPQNLHLSRTTLPFRTRSWFGIERFLHLGNALVFEGRPSFSRAGQSGAQGPGLRRAVHVRGFMEGAPPLVLRNASRPCRSCLESHDMKMNS